MAKKHSNDQHSDDMNGADNVFVLEPDAYGEVTSSVRSMKIKNSDGTMVNVPEESMYIKKTVRFVDGSSKEVDDERFRGTRFVPFMRVSASRDELLGNLARFMDELEQFDQTTKCIVAPNNKYPNGRNINKGYKLLVDNDGQAVSVVDYISGLINKGHTLEGNQKPMQIALRTKAEPLLREELGIDKPVGKVRTKKESNNVVVDDSEVDASI